MGWVGAALLAAVACAGIVTVLHAPAFAADKQAAKAHWAYQPLNRPAIPRPNDADWARNPVDAFVLAKLQDRGIHPSAQADRRTLIRRVHFDLIGLPPTPDDVRAFVADPSSDAYEKLVDRLLASPRYGERWAQHWIDVVHFAETHGNDQDRVRPNAWPYRDYLIRSFNTDKPYARFVGEQLAGDVLYPDDPQATVALGFLAAGPWDESSQMSIQDGTIDKLVARNLDRDDMLTTTMSTFASTTVHCARCHNHKFDPVSQAEYYNLQSCFAGVDRAERPFDADPKVHLQRQTLLRRKLELDWNRDALTPALLAANVQDEVAAWERTGAKASDVWTALTPDTFTASNGTTLVLQKDNALLASGSDPDTDVYTITASTKLKNVTAIRVEVLADDSLPAKGPGRAVNGNFHLTELRLFASPKSGGATTAPSAETRVELQHASADFEQPNYGSATAIDGQPQTGWGVHPAEGKPHHAVYETKNSPGYDGGTTLKFVLEQQVGRKHTIGRVRLSVTTAPRPVKAEVIPPDIATILKGPAEKRTDAQRVTLAVHVLKQRIDSQLAALPQPAQVYAGTTDFRADGSFTPAKGCRPVLMLKRGDVAQPAAAAVPGGLACVPGLSASFELSAANDESARRAALANWLTDPKNVLTWRSIVNRVWHHHFGRGLCDTPNDLGLMGGKPSHPELIDWLAVWFRDDARGSLKALHRMLVTSATYRQSSAHDADHAKLDGDNRLLWRMNRSRLDAESVHDAILQMTGKLDLVTGGASVKQFNMSPGRAQTPNVDYVGFSADDPANFRRSVYRFLFRTIPDPFMETMDCPDLSQLTPVRSSSVTALQALAMLNDKFTVRQSEHLADRLAALSAEPSAQITALFQLAMNRDATPREIERLTAHAQKHGMANVCRLVINSNEFMFVD
jgi:hypothetical protein